MQQIAVDGFEAGSDLGKVFKNPRSIAVFERGTQKLTLADQLLVLRDQRSESRSFLPKTLRDAVVFRHGQLREMVGNRTDAFREAFELLRAGDRGVQRRETVWRAKAQAETRGGSCSRPPARWRLQRPTASRLSRGRVDRPREAGFRAGRSYSPSRRKDWWRAGAEGQRRRSRGRPFIWIPLHRSSRGPPSRSRWRSRCCKASRPLR